MQGITMADLFAAAGIMTQKSVPSTHWTSQPPTPPLKFCSRLAVACAQAAFFQPARTTSASRAAWAVLSSLTRSDSAGVAVANWARVAVGAASQQAAATHAKDVRRTIKSTENLRDMMVPLMLQTVQFRRSYEANRSAGSVKNASTRRVCGRLVAGSIGGAALTRP
ncbi:MAG TPA: hypothetical protein VGG01_26745 [Xanthobacteraceae bacterium]|jgi:hypothetical protein